MVYFVDIDNNYKRVLILPFLSVKFEIFSSEKLKTRQKSDFLHSNLKTMEYRNVRDLTGTLFRKHDFAPGSLLPL